MRTYKRDSSGRFAGGGGKARKAARPDSPVAPVPPTALRFQTGERLKAGLRKASASQLQAIDNSATSRQLRNAVFNEKARRASIAKGGATGARLGGKRKIAKIDAIKRSMSIMKKTAENYNLKLGAKEGTPEANKVGVKAGVRFNRQRRITKAAKRAGLGAGRKKQ